MSVNMKLARQKLMQTAILDKIERDHLRLDTEAVRRSLQTVREHVSASPYFTTLLDRWEHIVVTNDIDALRQVVNSDNDTSSEMRNLSPLHVLLNEDERLAVLDELHGIVLRNDEHG